MKKHNALEKAVFTLGILVILGIFGYLTYQATWIERGPPELSITSSSNPRLSDNAYEIHIFNIGKESAANANIKVSLYQDGKSVESSTLNFDYIPAKSEVKGWAVFRTKRKPTDSLVVSSIGFIKE